MPNFLVIALVATVVAVSTTEARPLDFDRDIRPILSENCFACHGPDAGQRKADLRLDVRTDALLSAPLIVPGHADQSELLERVASTDPKRQMPPCKTGKKLTALQIELLRQWIDQGAHWSAHWAFVAPQRSALPRVTRTSWPRNPIDHFILARLDAERLTPSPEAGRATLLRRVTLDLTGLPPTPAEVDAFENDTAPDAYERVVDRLLASPRYGERMALDWLDAARYADTHGYHRDAGRDMTSWRDGVIAAFNGNMPFDRFTIEQLAGDLLPAATRDQQIASGFNRNHMIMIETGAVPEEYQTAYVVDRVNTTATVWLGLTLGCAQCHDHKYDPFTQKEYYGLYAFFNNLPENGIDGGKGNAVPLLKLGTSEQQRALDHAAEAVKEAERRIKAAGVEESKRRRDEATLLRKKYDELDHLVPSAMVMRERPEPRETFVLLRGQYDHKSEPVAPGTPAALPALRTDDEPTQRRPTRLDLARWLVRDDHPLTARVTVNRYWQAYFGSGLVKTSEDFGVQGERPSHPELLDWLAVEFRDSGWDVKHMQRLIVTSATYRQSSRITLALRTRDPEDRLLARMSRFRLPAEFIRDQALAVSGLLNGDIGGPSVFPYQPSGLWEELCSRLDSDKLSAQTYVPSKGRALYRRSMYTFWKRTAPLPTLATLDAPDRETCVVRRARTNTPLQALVLLNDPTYVEASWKLAERVIEQGGRTPRDRIRFLYRLVLGRRPGERELQTVERIVEQQLAVYRSNRPASLKLLDVGESLPDPQFDDPERAAWTVVTGILLNLDETVTRN